MKVLSSVINTNVSKSDKHSHPCWEIVYRLSGNSNTTIGNQAYSIIKGDLYMIPPNVLHYDASQELFSDLVILVDDFNFSETLILHDYDTFISSLTNMINCIINKKENNYQDIANSLVYALFQYIRSLSPSLSQNHFVHRLKNTIFENVENIDFNLTKEIRNMGYHPDYVRRCFKAETNKTPFAYLTDLRIDRAKQLLALHTCESIEIISAKCGFQDSFYFSTCFKKHTGLSPLQYRKKNLSKHWLIRKRTVKTVLFYYSIFSL